MTKQRRTVSSPGASFVTPLAAVLFAASLAAACGPGGGAADGSADDSRDSGAAADSIAAADSAAAAAAPAADTALPAAILGTAPPPRGQDVAYFEADPATLGYVSVPAGEGPFPAIILIHEWDGLVDRIRQTADALADEGYVALAVDLYHGQTGGSGAENRELVQAAIADSAGMMANLAAAVDWLKARPDVTGRIGAVGWCFGGGVALSFGLDGPAHDATAIFYGRLIDDPERLAALDHEVYGTFAALDDGISRADVEAFAAALDAAGIENDIHVYDGVDHGFWLYVDEDPEARTAPARDAWHRLRAYFDRTLGD